MRNEKPALKSYIKKTEDVALSEVFGQFCGMDTRTKGGEVRSAAVAGSWK